MVHFNNWKWCYLWYRVMLQLLRYQEHGVMLGVLPNGGRGGGEDRMILERLSYMGREQAIAQGVFLVSQLCFCILVCSSCTVFCGSAMLSSLCLGPNWPDKPFNRLLLGWLHSYQYWGTLLVVSTDKFTVSYTWAGLWRATLYLHLLKGHSQGD